MGEAISIFSFILHTINSFLHVYEEPFLCPHKNHV
jgi:hypothetical protein